jgi:hypothetical protein
VYSEVSVISATYPSTTIQQATDLEIQAADGSSVLAPVVLRQTTRSINSGRAHYYLTIRCVLGGSITFPYDGGRDLESLLPFRNRTSCGRRHCILLR